eukprot:COSAG02_NODE_53316_length_302_cov_1.256158_1_plen_63_part_10
MHPSVRGEAREHRKGRALLAARDCTGVGLSINPDQHITKNHLRLLLRLTWSGSVGVGRERHQE